MLFIACLVAVVPVLCSVLIIASQYRASDPVHDDAQEVIMLRCLLQLQGAIKIMPGEQSIQRAPGAVDHPRTTMQDTGQMSTQ